MYQPIFRCKKSLKNDSRASVTRSPRLAAMGVATLSGLIPYFFERMMTAHITPPRRRLANDAVMSELAHIRNAW